MAEFPAMPLWTDAYLADTGHLTTLEHGAYLLLLVTMWRAGGSLPNDPKKLAKFTRLSPSQWDKVSENVMEFFDVDGDEITQKRLEKEMKFVRERSRMQSEKAKARYLKYKETPDAVAMPEASRTPAPTPTPTPTDKKEPSVPKKGTRIPDDFEPDIQRAVEAGLRPERALIEAAKFKNYWQAKAGKDATKLDWPKTWVNWYLSAIERQGGPRGSPGRGKQSNFREHQDEVTRNLERQVNGNGSHSRGRQSAFDLDLEPTAFNSDRSSTAGKR